jgi:uncharacterized protein (DUF3820 family)
MMPDKGTSVDKTPNNDTGPSLQDEQLLKLANYRMPFGKYKGQLLIDLPEPYVVWFAKQGFPNGELGTMLRIVYEIKLNGLEYLFKPLRKPG